MKKVKLNPFKLELTIIAPTVILMLSMLIFLAFPSCENENDGINNSEKNNGVYEKGGIIYSGCKNEILKSTLLDVPCVTLQTIDSNYLKIKHINAIFNCAFDSLTIDYTITGNVITIQEKHVNPNAFCICNYDIEYIIGPLEYGTYSVKISDESLDDTEMNFEFEFTDNSLITFCNK